jgi:uncharacterized protein (DUF2249 family)
MLSIDLPALPPARRVPVLLDACDALIPGAALEIVDDHDPTPLYFRLDRVHPGGYAWSYLQNGPDRWRVRVTRLHAAPAADPNPSDILGNS